MTSPAGDEGTADVVIIGAGVVGTAIARELSRYQLSVVLVDAANDVGTGTTKANTAILHTGFDTVPGSLESRLLRRGSELLRRYAERVGIPVERTGALLIAWTPDQLRALPEIEAKARQNGYSAIAPVGAASLYRREPHLGAGALGALEIPDESIVCPWTTPLAYATQAVAAGVRLWLNAPVSAITRANGWHLVTTDIGSVGPGGHSAAPGALSSGDTPDPHGPGPRWPESPRSAGPGARPPESPRTVRCRWLVNAAGLGSDRIDQMLGGGGFTITPRRGELIVFDKLARTLIGSILLPVPTPQTKGVLVAPTVFGNVLLGPTAQDVTDRADTATTGEGISSLLAAGRTIVPDLLDQEVTATYSGLRAATEHRDYQIRVEPGERYACVAGIRSTGLSASLGIAEYVVDQMGGAGLPLSERGDAPKEVVMPYIGQAGTRPYQDPALIVSDRAYGQIVCHCERVTLGEIRDALASRLPPADLDGLRRRTRALNGRCQGFFCGATVARLAPLATRSAGDAA